VTGPLSTAALVDMGDMDGLLVRVDHLCADRDWAGLVDLRDRCRRAVERGHQLWPVASHAEYRLALEGPGREAAGVLVPGAGRFALGPLSEVAASSHTWAELRPWAPRSPEAGMAAHERVVRGEDLVGDDSVDATVLELPLRLQPWEPEYPLATYRPHSLEVDDVPEPDLGRAVTAPPAGAPAAGAGALEATRALEELAMTWRRESNGTVAAVAVVGDAAAAVAALGAAELRTAEVPPAHALALMAATAASGGAHGRRRGMAYGRFSAWWTVAALAGGLDDWPFDPDELGSAAASLRWYRWEPGLPEGGWSLRLAAEDPATGTAWAVEAGDRVGG
jgi:hypothetical protein